MRISSPSAIILGAIIASIILTGGAKLVGASFWSAFGAISTFAAVIWAIFHQDGNCGTPFSFLVFNRRILLSGRHSDIKLKN